MKKLKTQIFIMLAFFHKLLIIKASMGDESQYFKTCKKHCQSVKCRGGQYLKYLDEQPWYYIQILGWDCLSECQYKCTRQTVQYFIQTQNVVPRFFSSFPLERIFGLREVASWIFLSISILCQFFGLIKFLRKTPKSSPIRPLILKQGILSIICCILGCIYHALVGGGNDPKINNYNYKNNIILGKILSLTLTYTILHFMYMGVYRFLWRKMPAEIRGVWLTLQIVFGIYSGICFYFLDVKIKYFFLANALLAFGSSILWMFFCWKYWSVLSHIWKMIMLLSTATILFIFELEKFPPIYNLLDSHALWNLGMCPLPLLWYSFAIDDSFFLYRELSAYKVE